MPLCGNTVAPACLGWSLRAVSEQSCGLVAHGNRAEPRTKPRRGGLLEPDRRLVVGNLVFSEQAPDFRLKIDSAVMQFLIFNVFVDGADLRMADREGSE